MPSKKKNTKDKPTTEKVIIKRKYTNEITPIQAILPLVLEEIDRKRKKYKQEHPEEFES